jgi:preprotein translocase subunit SecE
MKLTGIIPKVKSFLKEAYLELKKVNWLNRRDLFKYTFIVVFLSLVIAAFLGGLDYLFSFLIKRFVLYK